MTSSIIYPGTFDPITNGHIDLIKRAGRLFDRVVVAVASHSQKETLFTLEEREMMVKESLSDYHNVEICSFSGLLVEFVQEEKIMMILRGLRAISDFEYELQLASINRQMEPRIETVFLTPSEKYAYVSASMVREIASLGGDVSLFVPGVVKIALQKKLSQA